MIKRGLSIKLISIVLILLILLSMLSPVTTALLCTTEQGRREQLLTFIYDKSKLPAADEEIKRMLIADMLEFIEKQVAHQQSFDQITRSLVLDHKISEEEAQLIVSVAKKAYQERLMIIPDEYLDRVISDLGFFNSVELGRGINLDEKYILRTIFNNVNKPFDQRTLTTLSPAEFYNFLKSEQPNSQELSTFQLNANLVMLYLTTFAEVSILLNPETKLTPELTKNLAVYNARTGYLNKGLRERWWQAAQELAKSDRKEDINTYDTATKSRIEALLETAGVQTIEIPQETWDKFLKSRRQMSRYGWDEHLDLMQSEVLRLKEPLRLTTEETAAMLLAVEVHDFGKVFSLEDRIRQLDSSSEVPDNFNALAVFFSSKDSAGKTIN